MGYIELARCATAAVAGTGIQAAPGSSATITAWSSENNNDSAGRGNRYKRLAVGAYSSHVSATDGLKFEEKINSTWRTLVTYTLAATTYTKYYIATSAPAVRVRYVNSANVLTEFDLVVLGDTEERTAA